MAAWLDLLGMLGGPAGPTGPKSSNRITSLGVMATPVPFTGTVPAPPVFDRGVTGQFTTLGLMGTPRVFRSTDPKGDTGMAMQGATFRFVFSRIHGAVN